MICQRLWAMFVVLSGLAISAAPSAARAQDVPTYGGPDETAASSQWRLTLSGGYARLGSSGGDTLLDNVDGWYIDAEFAKRLVAEKPWWLGLSLSTSYYWQSQDVPANAGGSVTDEIDAQLTTIAIEPRLTYDILGRRGYGLHLNARIGAGLLIAEYYATSFTSNGAFITGRSDTELAFEVRPGVELGYSRGLWSVGGEASYMFAWGDFGKVGDMLDELRLGVFFRLNF